jgi:hypothetical protein
MRNCVVAALLGLSLVSPVFGVFHAEAQERSRRSNPLYPEQAILDWNGQRFNVLRIDYLEDRQRDRVKSTAQAGARYADDMQRTIRANRKLAAALGAQGVRLGTIALVRQAMSGGLIFYIK